MPRSGGRDGEGGRAKGGGGRSFAPRRFRLPDRPPLRKLHPAQIFKLSGLVEQPLAQKGNRRGQIDFRAHHTPRSEAGAADEFPRGLPDGTRNQDPELPEDGRRSNSPGKMSASLQKNIRRDVALL